ncbi:hypothetical protein LCGC14_0964650 [marine sediment metagenome]|uniref:Uncharacterized protein n=1 Tax=marine sediment metagenome TaxID=412755 RepID=A0A0F9NDH3_9ZZZZ
MAERLSDRLREYLSRVQGRVVNLKDLRVELRIDPKSPAWDGLRVLMLNLVKEKIVSPSGRNDGVFKVITQYKPVRVFMPGRERRPVFNLVFPRAFDTMAEMSFASQIVIREGDLVTIGGVKSMGKTTLCLNICGGNIDKNPVLMGNEYTVTSKGEEEPAPRFLHRLDVMSEWIDWTNEEGYDKFTLLPVRDDYAEHIVADRINIIDWINLDGNQLYDISKILGTIKANLGRGVAIVALQKGEGAFNPRGGQFVRDFSDVEILLDGYGENEFDILLTLKGAKEKKGRVVGKTYAYTLEGEGTKIMNFREVVKCHTCWGKGWKKSGNTSVPCDCKTGYVNKEGF